GQDIVVGEFASLTGSEATFGINSSNGVELAKEEINNAGGVLGRKIRIVLEDDQSKPGQPSAAVKKLIASDKAIAIVGEIASARSFSGGGTDRDFRAQLTAIKAAQPEAIFVPGYYTEAGLIAKQARSLGIKVPLLGGDGWDSPKLSEIGGSAIDGCYFSTHFSPKDQNPKVQDFVHKYQAKFNAMPDGMAPLGYDAMMILADAIKAAGSTDGTKVR